MVHWIYVLQEKEEGINDKYVLPSNTYDEELEDNITFSFSFSLPYTYIGETKNLLTRSFCHKKGNGGVNTCDRNTDFACIYRLEDLQLFFEYDNYITSYMDNISLYIENYKNFNCPFYNYALEKYIEDFYKRYDKEENMKKNRNNYYSNGKYYCNKFSMNNLNCENFITEKLLDKEKTLCFDKKFSIDNSVIRGGKYVTEGNMYKNIYDKKMLKKIPMCDCGLVCTPIFRMKRGEYSITMECPKKNFFDVFFEIFGMKKEEYIPCGYSKMYKRDLRLYRKLFKEGIVIEYPNYC